MQPEHRANGATPLPPTRTTRLNGGPRPGTPQPLPPFRASVRGAPKAPPAGPLRVPSPRFSFRTGVADGGPQQSLPATPSAQPDEPPRFTFDEASAGEGPAEDDEDEPAAVGAALDDFPLDAFYIPEGLARLPTGLREADRRQRHRAVELAVRLESLAQRLRREGYSALARQTVHGDPVDALIAGILAGYLAAVE